MKHLVYILTAFVPFCQIATAKIAETTDTTLVLSEVSVSEIKSRLQNPFPAAETVIGRAQIERDNIEGLKGAAEIVPNVFIPDYGSRMTSSVYVRGLGARIDQPVMGLTVDNVPILTKDAYDFSMPDIRSIAVERGPQSSLYGRNTMGGVINILTESPWAFQGERVMAEYGSYNTFRIFGSSAKKLSEKFAASGSVGYNRRDGYFRNEYTGRKADNEWSDMAKIRLSWRPSARFMAENIAWVTDVEQGGFPYASAITGRVNHNDTCCYRRTTFVDGLTLRWVGGKISHSSVTSVQYLDDRMDLDQDFLPQDYFTMRQARKEWTLTQDFVITGRERRYDWLAGVWGYWRRGRMDAPVTFKDAGLSHLIEDPMQQATGGAMAIRWDERQMLLNSHFTLPDWGWAIYHRSQYTLGRWNFSGALRLAFERSAIDYRSWVNTAYTLYLTPGGGRPDIPLKSVDASVDIADRLHQTSLQLLPQVKVAYEIGEDMNVGAVFSKGHKAGGYNTQMFSDILQQALMGSMGSGAAYDVEDVIAYEPEVSWNYELNFDGRFFGGRLSVDATLFLIHCLNQQMTVFPHGTTTGRMMANAGRTRSVGAEVALSFRPDSRWTVAASWGYANARFRSYNDGLADYRGRHVPYAPENTLFASATYAIPVRSGFVNGIELSADCRGAGKIYWNEANTLSQPFYATVGATVTARCKWGSATLWGENLNGCRYTAFHFMSMGNSFFQYGAPRRIGLTLRLDFAAQ